MTLSLTCVNFSTVPGPQYFLIYPPALTLTPAQPQTRYPTVSDPTQSGSDRDRTEVSWDTAPDGLYFLAVEPGQPADQAARVAVSLGDTVTVSWENGTLVATVVPGGAGGVITVISPADIPASAAAGLVAGPGAVTFPLPEGGGTTTVALASTQTVSVQFGTPPGPNSNLSPAAAVSFEGASASVTIGPDNIIRQDG